MHSVIVNLLLAGKYFFAFFVVVSVIDEVTTKRCLAFNQSINQSLFALTLGQNKKLQQ